MDDCSWIDRLGALVAIVGLPYLIYEHRKRQPNLRFDAHSHVRSSFIRDGLIFGKIEFIGEIRNKSLEANSIYRVHLVVWRNRWHTAVKRGGWGGVEIYDQTTGDLVGPPLQVSPRQVRPLRVICEFPLTGTGDAQLFNAMRRLPTESELYIPATTYEVMLEDVMGNSFDWHGFPVSQRLVNLRWTLPNVGITW